MSIIGTRKITVLACDNCEVETVHDEMTMGGPCKKSHGWLKLTPSEQTQYLPRIVGVQARYEKVSGDFCSVLCYIEWVRAQLVNKGANETPVQTSELATEGVST